MFVPAQRRSATLAPPAARAQARPVVKDIEQSPAVSLGRVLLTLVICLVLSVLVDARGLIHAGKGMDYGTERSVTLAIGNAALAVASPLHLTWPWQQLAAARGYHDQPSVPPLLATGSTHPAKSGTGTSGPKPPRTDRPQPVVISSRHAKPVLPKQQRPAPWRPPHWPTKRNPLRLLVTGDSLTGYLGPVLVNEASSAGPTIGQVDTHDGTGLTRPDFVDWSLVAQQQVASFHPDAVVVMIGGNDFQNMTLGNRVFIAGTRAWRKEYERRAVICMRIWSQDGTRRVYWLSMPPARDPGWAYDDSQINIALQAAARQVRGALYLNILGPITNHGRYTDFVNTASGPLLIREQDGVHLNLAGSTIVANEVLGVIKSEWRLGWRHPAHPRPSRSIRAERYHLH